MYSGGGPYKLRPARMKTGTHYSISVPRAIGEALGEEVRFSCELTDEGILFRPIARVPQTETQEVQVPEGLKAILGEFEPESGRS